jgi:hypothetical protein
MQQANPPRLGRNGAMEYILARHLSILAKGHLT